ncbi:hypothetical protein GCM10029978_060300 [Actinoallomurus acanthiterrae]
MKYLVAGLVLVAVVTALNLVLTVAVVRRRRARMSAPPAAQHHRHDHVDRNPDLGIAPGDRMPEFTATTADGATVNRDELAGRR